MSHILIYLDESGCLGCKNPKASRYFVITLLKLDNLEIQKSVFSAVKKTIKNKITIKKRKTNYELKGSKTNLSVKQYFLRHMPLTGWSLYSVVVHKEKVCNQLKTTEGKKKLYNDLAKYLLKNVTLDNNISRLDLYMDRCKNTKEIREFNTYIEAHLNLAPTIFLNINHVTSHENPAIQAVDMFCWGIARKHSLNEIDWYECFSKNIKFESIYSTEQKESGVIPLTLVS